MKALERLVGFSRSGIRLKTLVALAERADMSYLVRVVRRSSDCSNWAGSQATAVAKN